MKENLKGYSVKEVHISAIAPGDTILHNDGKIRTVGGNDIRRSEFIGNSLFGDCYKLGYQLVKKILV